MLRLRRVCGCVRILCAVCLQGPTAFPEFNAAGYNTSTFAYPAADHGDEPYYNEFDGIEVPYGKWSTNGTPFEENPLPDSYLVY